MSTATTSGRQTTAVSTARRAANLRKAGIAAVLLCVLGFALNYSLSNGHVYVPDRGAPNRPKPSETSAPAVVDALPAVGAVLPTATKAPEAPRSITRTEFDDGVAQQLAKLDIAKEADIAAFLERSAADPAATPGAKPLEKLVASLHRLRGDEDPCVRAGALAALGCLRDPDLLQADPFVACFGDADPRVRREAVTGRMRQGVLQHWASVVPLTADPDAKVRAAVVCALGDVGDVAARAAVAGMLVDADDDVVEAAATAIGRRRDATVVPYVLKMIESDRPGVRLAGVRVLARIRSRDCMAPLVVLLGDADAEMRLEAIRSLATFEGEPAIEARVRVERVAFDAERGHAERFEALQQLAATASEPDTDGLHEVAASDADASLRLAAARSLLARRDRRACAALLDLVEIEKGEDREFVRSSAARTLRDAFGAALPGEDARSWKKSLADLEARVALAEFSYRPEPITAR